MSRKPKYKVKLNNQENLERLMQEIYTDANAQITSAQEAISNLKLSTEPVDVPEHALIAKEKANLMKIKDSAIKIKLDMAKIKTDLLKNIGDTSSDIKQPRETESLSDALSETRALIEKSREDNKNNTSK